MCLPVTPPAIARDAVEIHGSEPGSTKAARPAYRVATPLRGKVVVLDPGHQLGNSRHLRAISRQVNAGGFYKACNTTGTATNGGFAEATFAWRTAQALKRQLTNRGATVYLTRTTNSYADWGPCIDVRGRKGNRVHADAVVSIHGDGASSTSRGFFVILPGFRRGWTGDIVRSSHRYGLAVKRGLVGAGARLSNSYGGDGFDVRTDLGTLNWSDVPIVMVELGNMRNPTDARHMTSPRYRAHVYARGLRVGLVDFVLDR
ncbi:MAG: N-acetylmuramoyl-L-alanine amidase [Propionibacteriales bacterium]|nr:N-acetylmuramoyl-L-alanine amidase [Propionibacteriales bacterium]